MPDSGPASLEISKISTCCSRCQETTSLTAHPVCCFLKKLPTFFWNYIITSKKRGDNSRKGHIPPHFYLILWYHLLTDPKVLEAIADDKVEERLFDEDNSRQLWRKGCKNNQGYFTLENDEVGKFLTATADDLKIVSKSELVILEQMGHKDPSPMVLTNDATSK